MTEGRHSILFYNNNTEYIVFNDLTSSATSTATTRTRTRAGFSELHKDERTVGHPICSTAVTSGNTRRSPATRR